MTTERLDYRTKTTNELDSILYQFGKTSKMFSKVLDGLLAVAVFHSIKDGQVTPAIKLMAAIPNSLKTDCSLYLTKYGNIRYDKKEGYRVDKTKNAASNGIDEANRRFMELPTLEEAFPKKEKQYKDIPFSALLKRIVDTARETQAAGHSILFSDETGKELFTEMEKYFALHVKV